MGDQPVGAKEGAADLPAPPRGRKPELPGKLVVEEAGGDAHMAVVAADVIRTEQGSGEGEEALRTPPSSRFAEDEQPSVGVEVGSEVGEGFRRELMQDHVAHDDPVAGPVGELFEVGLMPVAPGRPVPRLRPQVESVNLRTMRGEFVGEFAEPGAEFEHAFVRFDQRGQGADEPAHVAHEGVDQAQIAPVVEGVGVMMRQRIEQFRDEAAFHEEEGMRERVAVK